MDGGLFEIGLRGVGRRRHHGLSDFCGDLPGDSGHHSTGQTLRTAAGGEATAGVNQLREAWRRVGC